MPEEKIEQSELDFKKDEEAQEDQVIEENAEDEKEKKSDKVIVTKQGEEFTLEEWESPIFDVENAPTRKQVEEWKDMYKYVYFTPVGSDFYIWRALSRKEYREIIEQEKAENMSVLDREEIVMNRCLLYPKTISSEEEGRAGLPTILSTMIMDKSGFVADSAPIRL